MESRDRAAQAVTDSFAWRTRLFVSWLVLTAIAFVQQPGRIVADTKIDLVVDPGRFMERATSLWDPIGYFGQVQNQAYGYFVPMGPFFYVGNKLQLDPWVIQRLWWALVLIVAFTGFVFLARELKIGAPWAQLVGGFAFALSPRMLSVLGPSSIEVWPMALAPWVLLALVIGTTRRSPTAMAAASALAVAAVGGVNAAATFAVIPLCVIWLVMTPPGPRRRRMMFAWPVFVLAGTLWWLVPLVLLGKYSPPFLDFIESASLTSFDTTLLDSLRGTSNWTTYLSSTSVAGANLVSEPVLLINLAVVLALSMAGLARRDLPHRRFLFVSVLLGLILVTLGHTASHGGLGASQLQELLDGVLSPLRNTHKFDVIIRIPLVLSLVHVLTKALGEVSPSAAVVASRRLAPTFGFALLGVVAVVGSTSPAWTAQIPPRGSFESIPKYWEQTASWLADQDPEERALVVPASAFGSYLWGNTNDDVMQPLATTPWGVRNAIPLVPPGNIEMLDAVERELTDGRGSAALQQFLLDSGISMLVVRNDLALSGDGLDQEIVHAALADMPSVELVASFGPVVGGEPTIKRDSETIFIDQGWQAKHDAVEIYRVGRRPPVRAQRSSSVPVVIGGPDTQVGLLESGLVRSPSVIFANDLPAGQDPGAYVLTDGMRRQEVAFGRVHFNRSASVALDEKYGADRPVHEYSSAVDDRWASVPELLGAASITASSSLATVRTTERIDQSAQPWSAFDDDPLTSWRAARTDIGGRSWIRVTFDKPVNISGATVVLDGDPLDTTELAVRTDTESAVVNARHGVARNLDGVSGTTRSLTISAAATAKDILAISDIRIPGVEITRPLKVPGPKKSWGSPQSILLQAGAGYRSGCLTIEFYLRCASGMDTWGEDGRVIDRIVTIPAASSYPISLTVEPIGGAALDALLQQDRFVTIAASSQVVRSAQASALAAVDGDITTTWTAKADDSRPRLTVSWIGERKVSKITARLDSAAAASRATKALLRFADGTRRDVRLDANGQATFDPVTTQRVEIEFTDSVPARNLDSVGGAEVLPVGISELRLSGTGLLPVRADPAVKRYACGTGPSIVIDGTVTKTRIQASPAELRTGKQFQAVLCKTGDAEMAAGEHRVRVLGTDAIRPVRLAMGDPVEAPETAVVESTTWKPTHREVSVDDAGDQLLTVTENENKGWEISTPGATSVEVNGWQQGWQLPPDAKSAVELTYGPNGFYRAGLVVGGALVVALLGVWILLARRSPKRLLVAEPRRFRWREAMLAGVTLVGSGLILGGVVGLLAGAFGYATAITLRRWLDESALVGALVLAVAAASVIRPWGGQSMWLGAMDWPQVMIAVACGAVAASVFGLPRRRKRSKGVSTTA